MIKYLFIILFSFSSFGAAPYFMLRRPTHYAQFNSDFILVFLNDNETVIFPSNATARAYITVNGVTNPPGSSILWTPNDINGPTTNMSFSDRTAWTNTITFYTNGLFFANASIDFGLRTKGAVTTYFVIFTNAPVISPNPPVTTNQAPLISIISPTNGTTKIIPGNFSVFADAVDRDGQVLIVIFRTNNVQFATFVGPVFSASLSALGVGTYLLDAIATDNKGVSTTSSSITLNVVNPIIISPTVIITAPTNGLTITNGASLTVDVTATSSTSTITKVELYNGTNLWATDLTFPYSFVFSNMQLPVSSFTAKAYQLDGGSKSSSSVSVFVVNPPPAPTTNQVPIVSFSSPTNGVTFTAPVNLTVLANASDPDGVIVQVIFIDNNTPIFTDSVAPYTFSYSLTNSGVHILSATATDNAGSNTTSTVSFTVKTNTPNVLPTISLISPINGQTLILPATIVLTASASDSDGLISNVQFFLGSSLLLTNSTSPYTMVYNPTNSGTYSFSAKATDNNGGSTISSVVTVTVVDPALSVSAGIDKTITLPATTTLTGQIISGLNVLSTNWSLSSGPGTVTFSNSNVLSTSVSFSTNGTYTFLLTITNSTQIASDPITVTVLPSVIPTNDVVVIPIEVMGQAGETAKVKFNLSGLDLSKEYFFYIPYHNIKNTNDFKFQVNNSALYNIRSDNPNITFKEPENTFGKVEHGINVGAPIRLHLKLAVGDLINGQNTASFMYTHTNRANPPTALTIFDFNVRATIDGANLIDTNIFVYDNPINWTPPFPEQDSILTGSNLWFNTPIVNRNSHCTTCHWKRGEDLAYFNYSNKRIIERSVFHGLSRSNATYVASYIRGSFPSGPGRPWNAPFQPGPGQSTRPVQEWMSGAGKEFIMNRDIDTFPYIFPSGVVSNIFSRNSNLKANDIPIYMALPDWNHWLPSDGPLDILNSNNYITNQSTLITFYEGGPNGANVGNSNLRTVLKTNDPVALKNARNIIGPWVLSWTTLINQLMGLGDVSDPTQVAIRRSLKNWQIVKFSEVMQEFHLWDVAGPAMFGTNAENRTAYTARLFFDVSPNLMKIIFYPKKDHDYLSLVWYEIQLLIDNGNRSPDNAGYYTNQRPVDWRYTYGFIKEVFNDTGLGCAMFNTLFNIKAFQSTADTYGPMRWETGGWDPYGTCLPDNIIWWEFSGYWKDIPYATRIQIAEGFYREYIYQNRRYVPSNFYSGDNFAINPCGGGGLTCPTYTPMSDRFEVTFGDRDVASFITGNSASINNIDNKGTALNIELRRQLIDWMSTVWPLGWRNNQTFETNNWSVLRP